MFLVELAWNKTGSVFWGPGRVTLGKFRRQSNFEILASILVNILAELTRNMTGPVVWGPDRVISGKVRRQSIFGILASIMVNVLAELTRTMAGSVVWGPGRPISGKVRSQLNFGHFRPKVTVWSTFSLIWPHIAPFPCFWGAPECFSAKFEAKWISAIFGQNWPFGRRFASFDHRYHHFHTPSGVWGVFLQCSKPCQFRPFWAQTGHLVNVELIWPPNNTFPFW